MKRTLAALTASACLFCTAAGCADSSGEDKSPEDKQESTASVQETSEKKKIKTSLSSLASPLSTGDTGEAAKYSTSEKGYFNVPVTLLSVETGDIAARRVRELAKSDPVYDFEEAGEDEQWVTADYELSLSGFPLDECGADASITAFVMSHEGDFVEKDGKKYGAVVWTFTDGSYYFEGTHGGTIAFRLPKELDDYVIVFGEYDETQAFFKK